MDMIWLTKMDLCEQSFENVTRTHTAVSPTRYICFRFMPPQRHLRCVGFNSHIRNSYNFFTKHYCKTNLYVITSELQCHVLGRNSITFTQYNYTSFLPITLPGVNILWLFSNRFVAYRDQQSLSWHNALATVHERNRHGSGHRHRQYRFAITKRYFLRIAQPLSNNCIVIAIYI